MYGKVLGRASNYVGGGSSTSYITLVIEILGVIVFHMSLEYTDIVLNFVELSANFEFV